LENRSIFKPLDKNIDKNLLILDIQEFMTLFDIADTVKIFTFKAFQVF